MYIGGARSTVVASTLRLLQDSCCRRRGWKEQEPTEAQGSEGFRTLVHYCRHCAFASI